MVQVQIALYDLLPPGKLSTAFYLLGVGIYHTAIRIPELQVEFAYGGILPQSPVSVTSSNNTAAGTSTTDSTTTGSTGSQSRQDGVDTRTGIFVLPSPADHRVPERLMPGLRFLRRIDLGDAFGDDWIKTQPEFGSRHRTARHKPLPALPVGSGHHSGQRQRQRPKRAQYHRGMSSSSSTGHVPLLQQEIREQEGGYARELERGQGQLHHKTSVQTVDEWGRTLSDLAPSTSDSISYETLVSSRSLQSEPNSMYAVDDTYSALDWKGNGDKTDLRNEPDEQSRHVGKKGNGYSTKSSFTHSRYSSYDEDFEGDPTVVDNVPPDRTSSASEPSNELLDILAIIDEMKTETAWRATCYHLLAKNCNNFTDELCYRLTGRRAPTWINRAAWLGQSLPCLVPEGWLEPPTADDDFLDRSSRASPSIRSSHLNRQERPTSPLLAMPYVKTTRMNADVAHSKIGGAIHP